jgi:hypothetical protein
MLVTSALLPTSLLLESPLLPPSMVTRGKAVSFPSFPDNVSRVAPVLVRNILVRCTRMAASLVARHPKLMCSRPRLPVSRSPVRSRSLDNGLRSTLLTPGSTTRTRCPSQTSRSRSSTSTREVHSNKLHLESPKPVRCWVAKISKTEFPDIYVSQTVTAMS